MSRRELQGKDDKYHYPNRSCHIYDDPGRDEREFKASCPPGGAPSRAGLPIIPRGDRCMVASWWSAARSVRAPRHTVSICREYDLEDQDDASLSSCTLYSHAAGESTVERKYVTP